MQISARFVNNCHYSVKQWHTLPPIKVYWRKDVEAKSIQVWGSLEEMELEKQKLQLLESSDDKELVSLFKRVFHKRNLNLSSPRNKKNDLALKLKKNFRLISILIFEKLKES